MSPAALHEAAGHIQKKGIGLPSALCKRIMRRRSDAGAGVKPGRCVMCYVTGMSLAGQVIENPGGRVSVQAGIVGALLQGVRT